MRFPFMPLALILTLAPMAQAHDHGRRDHDDFRDHRFCSEGPRWGARARWEARQRWEAQQRWEYRRRCEEEARYRRDTCAPWQREAYLRIPAPSFHVRIQLP